MIFANSAHVTRSIAGVVAGMIAPGDVVVLAGELGVGKTTFAQGVATFFGVSDPVTSPTFTLVQEYHGEGGVAITHMDVYRLEQGEELFDLGFEEILDGHRVVLVEWGDTVAPLLGPEYLEVRLERGEADDDRIVTFTGHGTRWESLVEEMRVRAEITVGIAGTRGS